ncbi:hypothetical protein ACWEQL_08440 [Kitasatospora sp. NPDC004240]
MSEARYRRTARWLGGLAVVPVVAYLIGRQAAGSGGLVEAERWLNHPVPLLGAAVVLGVAAVVFRFDFRDTWSQVGFACVLVALLLVGLPFALMSAVTGSGDGRPVSRRVSPDRPDRVLSVTDVAFSIDPVYRVRLVSGSGWSARHWDLGEWDGDNGHGVFEKAEWSGPDRITLTTDKEIRVYAVDPDGGPGTPEVSHR